MAQRIFLLPVCPSLVADVCDLVTCRESELGSRFAELRKKASAQARLNELSRSYASRLSEKAFVEAQKGEEHGLYVYLRPYVLTGASPGDVVDEVFEITSATTAALEGIFERQLQRVDAALLRPGRRDGEGSAERQNERLWEALEVDVGTLRQMRAAHDGGIEYLHPVPTWEPLGEDIQAAGRETEVQRFAGSALAEAYGSLLGATYGRFAGLVYPTWWLGRNFWFGPMLQTSRERRGLLFRRAEYSVGRTIRDCSAPPADLFSAVAIDGFESGFPVVCEGYSTGLYFPRERVSGILESLAGERRSWVSLASRTTGYSHEQVSGLLQMIEESFTWADRAGLGLIEGDDLVGAQGYR